MARERSIPRWLLGLISAWPLVALVFFVAISVSIYLLSERMERRLDDLEHYVHVEMPPPYSLPDFADHATDVDPATLPVTARVYVPAYSHVYVDGGRPFLLETALSIRNTDPDEPLYVDSVVYYDTKGRPSRTFVDQLLRLAPLETIEFVVEQRHTAGGSGANFLVRWRGERGVAEPVVEAVMAGTGTSHSLSFARPGVTIERTVR